MEFTGERYVPEIGGEIRQEHLHRYAQALSYVSGLQVLDIACGEGYGSALLARSAAQVTGVDISEEAVAHARATYGDQPRLRFLPGSAAQLPLEDGSVDVVVSFETIEHHDQHEEMMSEFVRVLRPGGLLVMSSPNKAVYTDEAQHHNEFHVKELYFEELDALTRRHFRHVTYLGQRFATGSVILPLAGDAPRRQAGALDLWSDDGNEVTARLPQLLSPMYFLVLARNGDVPPPLVRPSMLMSEAADLYLEFKRVARWASGVHQELVTAQAQAQRSEERSRDAAALARDADLRLDQLTTELHGAQAGQQALQQRLADEQAARERALGQRDAEWQRRLDERVQVHEAALAEARQREQALEVLARQQEAAQRAAIEGRLQAQRALEDVLARLSRQGAEFDAERRALTQELADVRAQAEADGRQARDLLSAAEAREAAARAHAARLQQALDRAEQAARERSSLEQALRARLEAEIAAVRQQATQTQQDVDEARRALAAQSAAAAQRLGEEVRRWRRALAAQVRESRGHQRAAARERRLAAEHAAAQGQDLQALRQRLDAAHALREDELRAARSREEAHAAALRAQQQVHDERVGRLQTLVVALQQQSHAADLAWQSRMDDLQQQARLLGERASGHMARQRAELMYRTEVAALLARHMLDARSSLAGRIAAPWRLLSERLPQGSPGHRRLWSELAVEALEPPATDDPGPHPAPSVEPVELAMSKQPSVNPPSMRSVDELLQMDDQAFVKAAYQSLLGRQPDAEGQRHYLDALLRGEPRLQVLHDLRHSEEGRGRTPQLRGLDEAMRALRRSRLPVVGRLFRATARPPEALGVRRKVETLTEMLERSQARLDERLARIEGVLQHVRSQAEQQSQAMAMAAAMARYAWPADTDLWRAAQQFAEGGIDRYVQDVFGFTLGRAPHGYELMYFREQLSQGTSRLLMLEKILHSPEFGNAHPPLLQPAAVAASGERPALSAPAALSALPSLPIYAEPLVSVIIPIYGKIDYTLRCLKSIAAHRPGLPFEVIVVDDCSPDDSAEVLAGVPGIRLERNPKNLGFIRSCNRGAALAHGTHLLFLNNDTEVHPHWLDELYRTFEIFPGTGLAGSKLVYPDGTLQEAGGILWRNGNAWNFGRGQDPALPVYNYAREVDYCSGASIMLPKALFDELGGFDEHYVPAYCEDSDLALKVRDRGLRVIYQPTSVVVHHEGITSGTDTGSGTKAYQVANSKKLFERWKDRLAKHQPDAENPDEAKDRMHRLRVLVLEHCTPTPDQDAGSVSVFNMLLLLREMGFQVTFIAEDNFLYLPDYTVMLQRAGIEVLYGPYVTSVKQHVQDQGGRYDMVYLFRPVVVERHIQTIRTWCPRARVLFYTHDIHHIRMEREAALLPGPERVAAAAAMKEREFKAIRSVDSTIVVSTAEMEILQPQLPDQPLRILPLLLNVPGTKRGFDQRQGLIFVGGYQHTPNVDAVLYFVAEVMPLLRETLPGVVFHVVGSKPPAEIQALASADVIVHGFVEDIGPLLDEMRVSVAPLRYGAGVKGKVGTALAAGLPTVATPIAAEGMSLVDGEQVIIGGDAQALAAGVRRLYTDAALWSRLSKAGHDYAVRTWGAEASFENLAAIVRGLGLATEGPRHPLKLYEAQTFAPQVPAARTS